jgi:hypothetical protein
MKVIYLTFIFLLFIISINADISNCIKQNNSSDIIIIVPNPNKRNPNSCENYEIEINYEVETEVSDNTCKKKCILNGNIGSIQLRDEKSRNINQCKNDGEYCSIPVVISEIKSIVQGICKNCKCTSPGNYN